MVDKFDEQWDYAERSREEKQLDETRRSFTRENVLEEQSKDTWCQELRKALGGEKVSAFVQADVNQCKIIGVIYHKDNQRNSLDGQVQLVMPEVFRRCLVEEIHGGILGRTFRC
jgi:hypothetical protein